MMPLSLMKAIDATIANTGESTLANQLLTAWSHDPGSARFFRTSANAVFTFTQAGCSHILRFNYDDERRADYIGAEIDYLQHLSRAGVSVARPVRSLAGRYVETMDTAQGRFHSVVFEAVSGQQFDIDDLTLDGFRQWGQTLGKLHAAAQSYLGVGRPTWQNHLTWATENIPVSERAAHDTIAKLGTQLDALPVTADTFGLIHFDFELDNLIWTDQGLTAIDFDDSAWYWFAADIAFALRDLFDDEVTKISSSSEPFQAFMAGYRTERAITSEEIEQLPLFLQLNHLIAFAQLLRTLEVVPHPEEPEWIPALWQKIARIAQNYRTEFIKFTQ
ncbi:MAG: phosphotransferase [Leptolyngbya sp. SIO1E4]|nr:phosphotransferase [Leptolyngbya sp. SIO1E4]